MVKNPPAPSGGGYPAVVVWAVAMCSACTRPPPPWGRVGKKKKRIHLQCRRPRFNPWLGKIPSRRKWLSTPVFLPRKSHGQRGLAGYSPWNLKESGTTE